MLGKLVLLSFLAVAALVITPAQTSADDLIVLGKGHAPIYVSNTDSGRFDFNNDGKTDYYVRAHYTGNAHQTYKVDYKISNECVDGDTPDAAEMKIGFSSTDFFFFDRDWHTDFEVWTPWFKAGGNDANKRIDLVDLPHGTLPIPFPASGDDAIVGDGKKSSFAQKSSMRELDGQPGWEGSVFFKGNSGEYFMWTIFPAGGTSGCDTLAAFAIPIVIKP